MCECGNSASVTTVATTEERTTAKSVQHARKRETGRDIGQGSGSKSREQQIRLPRTGKAVRGEGR